MKPCEGHDCPPDTRQLALRRVLNRRSGNVVCAAAVAVVAAALAIGCGDDEPQERSLTRAEAARLLDHLSAVRQAAAAQDPDGVRTRLRSFRREVRSLADENALTPAEERRLVDGAKQAQARAEQELRPAVPAEPDPVPQPVPPPAEAEGPDGGKEDDKDKEGKGNGGKGEERKGDEGKGHGDKGNGGK